LHWFIILSENMRKTPPSEESGAYRSNYGQCITVIS
jgi:hypothetical protein